MHDKKIINVILCTNIDIYNDIELYDKKKMRSTKRNKFKNYLQSLEIRGSVNHLFEK